jgi:hypothetical protein
MAVTPNAVHSSQPMNQLPQIVRWITLGGTTLAVGIAVSLIGMSSVGSWLVVVGAALMIWNLHRLGRTGAS